MIKLYPNRVRTALMTFTVASFSFFSASAQCPSGAISVSQSGSYGDGQVVCVSSDFTGNISLNSGSKLVIASGATFKGHINAASNVQIEIQANATLQPGTINNFGGKITNNGTARINFNFAGGSEIINNGTLNVNSSVNFNGSINITNSACGSLIFANSLTLNTNNAATFTNSGYVSIGGDFSFGQGNQLINSGKIYADGAAKLNGKITNDGYLVFKSGGHTLQGNDSLINKNVMVFAGSATIEKATRNEGLFWVTGSTTFQNANNFNETNPTALLRIDGSMSNFYAVIAGAGQAYIGGSYVNYNTGKLYLALTSTKKDTLNYTATMATPARPCGMSESSPLPIILQNFTAKANGNAAELHWSTVSELNGKAMIVQHSTDGTNFEDIATVASTTNSSIVQNYSYIDNNVVNGVNYYRLKLVSSDFPVSYSAVLAVKFNSTEQTDISVFPNPFSDHFTVKFADVKGGNAVAKLYNAQGAIVLVQTISGAGSVTINTPANLTKGVYILEISANNQKYYHRLMKL